MSITNAKTQNKSEADEQQEVSVDEQTLKSAVNKVADTAGNVLGFLGNLVFGTGRGTPEQLAELRAMITSVRQYLGQITRAFGNAAQAGMFKPISDKLNAFSKQTEAAFASNNPRQVQKAVQQASTVAAYATRFAQIQEDLAALIQSHRDDLDSGDKAKIDNVMKMMNNIIVRELTAVNLDKLGGVFRRIALLSKNIKLLPAPSGLTPQDLSKDYIDTLRTYMEEDQKLKQRGEMESATAQDMEGMAAANMVAESGRALRKSVQKLQLESLREYKSLLSESLKQVLSEQAAHQSAVDKFLAASAQVARGVTQVERQAAASSSAASPQQQSPAGQLTADQIKRMETMLQNVTSVMGRLTPEQKKRFSGLLGQLKTAIN